MRKLATFLAALPLVAVASSASADSLDLNEACLRDRSACWPIGVSRDVSEAYFVDQERVDQERVEPLAAEPGSRPAAPARPRLGGDDLLHRPGAAPLTGPGMLSNEHLSLSREELVTQHVIAPLAERRDLEQAQTTLRMEADASRATESPGGEVWVSISEDRIVESGREPRQPEPDESSALGEAEADPWMALAPLPQSDVEAEPVHEASIREIPVLSADGISQEALESADGPTEVQGRESQQRVADDPSMTAYDECVETSVRRGNTLRESMRVCASLHL